MSSASTPTRPGLRPGQEELRSRRRRRPRRRRRRSATLSGGVAPSDLLNTRSRPLWRLSPVLPESRGRRSRGARRSRPSDRLAAVPVFDQPQGHRHALSHFRDLRRRASDALLSIAIRAELMFPGIQVFPVISAILTGDGSVDAAKNMYNVFFTSARVIMIFFMVMPAMMGGFGNWFVPLDDRRARHGVSEAEQHVVLAARRLVLLAADLPVRRGRRPACTVSAAAGFSIRRFASNVGAPGPAADFVILSMHLAGMSSILGVDQFHRDDLQHARARHDHVSHAAVSVVGAGDRVPAAAVAAGAGRRADDAADRPQLPHDLLRAGGRRRPDPLPAPLLVLRPPGGLYPDHSGLRHHQPGRLDLFEEAGVRLRRHGLRDAARSRCSASWSGRTTCSRPDCR